MFKNLLAEIKGFKYQITLKWLLNKYSGNADEKFATLHFNSSTKNVISFEDSLEKSFQESFNRIDNSISEESASIIEANDGEYVNVFIQSPLSGSS